MVKIRKGKRKIRIKYKKERVTLSDVLPYEIPVTFSNRHFYRFLVSYGIEVRDNKLYWNVNNKKRPTKELDTLKSIMELLFDCEPKQIQNNQYYDLNLSKRRIPFIYKISHKENEFRELAIIHPKNQVDIVAFYEKYKELILYYCGVSRFSIRKPVEVAKYVFFNDKLHRQKAGQKEDGIEVDINEYEHLKTFFAYKKYTNIFRFYEDYRYQRAEKKFNGLLKFDISKCFDSIYTHSISWALLNKEIVKDNIPLSENTFPGKFDEFMQNINYGETNGILIGPEFSRIFAELILQQVDKFVENKLIEKGKIFGRDYECFRYVDDYFLFYNDDSLKNETLELFRLGLKEFKMWISESKTISYSKPIITEISMAKLRITDLLDSCIKFKIEEAEKDDENSEDSIEDECTFETLDDKFTIYLNPNKLAAKFKSILKETKVEYKQVLNYTLVVISRKVESIFKKYEKKCKEFCRIDSEGRYGETEQRKKYNIEKSLSKFILNVLDFVFFIYTVHPKVNSSLKLSVILITIIDYFKGFYVFEGKIHTRFRQINKDLIFKKIQDEIRLVLEKNKCSEHVQVETLYLLIILKELGHEYELSEQVLRKYFEIKENEETRKSEIKTELNTLSISVLLYYIADNPKYHSIKETLQLYIVSKIEKTNMEKRRKNTELTIMLFDLLSCPYLESAYKKDLLSLYDISDENKKEDILKFQKKQKYWFTKWSKMQLQRELNAKISQEVYS